MPPRNSGPWEHHQWKRWDDGKRTRDTRDASDPFAEIDDVIRRAAGQVRDGRNKLKEENEILRKRLREENGSLHDRLTKAQNELTARTQEVAVLETKLAHCEQNASKRWRSMFETAFGTLIDLDSHGSSSDGAPNASTPQEAGQPPESQENSSEVQMAPVVLPEGEGPGEAARTPTELADEPEGEALKGRCDSPSL